MITSIENEGWAGDVSLVDGHRSFGLPIPSVIRSLKVAVVETRVASLVGRAPEAAVDEVRRHIATYLGLHFER